MHYAPPALSNLYRPSFFIGPRRAHGFRWAFCGPTKMKRAITRPLLKMAGLAPLLFCFAVAQQTASTAAPSLTSIVQGMERSQSEVRAQGPYQVIREYRLFGAKNSSANAEVVTQVDFRPPTSQNYNIQKWSGSGRGKQVVQRVLDHEAEESRGNQARTALTTDNYDFTLIRETVLDGRRCYLIGLNPKRKEKDLILGTAWVDKGSLLILRIEGETAKSPSWWLRSVRIKLSFGDLSGTWLQTSMEAVADVRLLGPHTLTSRILDYRGSDISASTGRAPRRIPLRSQDLAP